MRPTAEAPTGIEHALRDDQIIVSKTDPQGRLTYVNNVFIDISRFTEEELIGQPHNVVRHPGMPRCAFKLLWDRLQAGQEVFAYIINLSKDGGHYWVLAHVTPTFDARGRITGYHSNRRAPLPGALHRIVPLYQQLLAEEARHRDTKTAIAAGTALLDSTLAGLGLTYDEFVWSITNDASKGHAA